MSMLKGRCSPKKDKKRSPIDILAIRLRKKKRHVAVFLFPMSYSHTYKLECSSISFQPNAPYSTLLFMYKRRTKNKKTHSRPYREAPLLVHSQKYRKNVLHSIRRIDAIFNTLQVKWDLIGKIIKKRLHKK